MKKQIILNKETIEWIVVNFCEVRNKVEQEIPVDDMTSYMLTPPIMNIIPALGVLYLDHQLCPLHILDWGNLPSQLLKSELL